ncbi:MAG TPA: hypothetical protein ENJ16_00100 [Planctomycetaceae bacterium]|nr:hypothetical protein [Planctomycetaceae bacterium]
MMQIDFLPQKFRERYDVRYQRLWRITVAALFIGVVGGTATLQHWLRCDAEERLEAIANPHVTALRINQELSRVYRELDRQKRQAALLTYLRHPWPMTRLLDQTLTPLEPSIALESLEVVYQPIGSAPRLQDVQNRRKAPGETEKKAGAQADLEELRRRYDGRRFLIRLEGATRDLDAFHRYLGKLALMPLFEHVEIGRLEHLAGDEAGVEFSVQITVRPGLGQVVVDPARQEQARQDQEGQPWQR